MASFQSQTFQSPRASLPCEGTEVFHRLPFDSPEDLLELFRRDERLSNSSTGLLKVSDRRLLDVALFFSPSHTPHDGSSVVPLCPTRYLHSVNPLLNMERLQIVYPKVWILTAEQLETVEIPSVGIRRAVRLYPSEERIDQSDEGFHADRFRCGLRHQSVEGLKCLLTVRPEVDPISLYRTEPRFSTLPEPRLRWTWHFSFLSACDETRCRLKGLLLLVGGGNRSQGDFVSEFRIRTLIDYPRIDVSPYCV